MLILWRSRHYPGNLVSQRLTTITHRKSPPTLYSQSELFISSNREDALVVSRGKLTVFAQAGYQADTANIRPRTKARETLSCASVEVTSEAKDLEIDLALVSGETHGWRATSPGTQTILLLFDQPAKAGRRGDISPVDFAVYPATPRAKPRLSQPFSVLFNFGQSQIWRRCKLLRELPVERRMPSG